MKKARHMVIFSSVLLVISIIIGIIYGINNYYDLTDYIESLNNHNNLFFYHIIVLLIFFFSTLSLLGIFIQSVFIGFEGISIGYVLSIFYANFKIKGLFYAITTIIVNKSIFIVVLLYLFYIGARYLKKNINNILGTNKDHVEILIKPLIKKYLIILIFILIYDTIIFFFGNIFLNYLTNML